MPLALAATPAAAEKRVAQNPPAKAR
jgi:hypothetical protein